MVQLLWETVWKVLKKFKIELPYDPATPLLYIYLKKTKTLACKYICAPQFTAALFTIGKTRKQPKYPLMDALKKCGVHINIYYIPLYIKWNTIQP